MLRIFLKRVPIQSLETSGLIPALFSGAGGACSQPLLSSPTVQNCHANGEYRFYSSSSISKRQTTVNWKSGLNGRNGSGTERSLLSFCEAPVFEVSSRSSSHMGYWGKEGRPGWRIRRRKEMEQREKILNPSSPVIDYKVPWPKDDFKSLPPDLFKEDIEKLSPEETRAAQNSVIKSINSQIDSGTEGRLFAVVHLNGKQFKVTPEDIIIVQGLFAPTVGDQIRLHKVLLVGGKDFTLLGSPLLENEFVRIEATVIEKTLSYTKLNFRMKKRLNYRRLKFHKTPCTMLRINLIEFMRPLNMIHSDSESASQQSSIA